MRDRIILFTDDIDTALDDYVRKQRGRNTSSVVRNAVYDYLTARGYKLQRPDVKRGGRREKKEHP